MLVLGSRTDTESIRINKTLYYHLFARNCAIACLATIHGVKIENPFNGTLVLKVSRCVIAAHAHKPPLSSIPVMSPLRI